ncbi:SseB family protein [Streptomyces sp. NPDC059740]|uniref:SseB family protein n=1 Tax=Streptomyces sp. NPDC059740 TaxID=3346926 RepID=UPI00364699E8
MSLGEELAYLHGGVGDPRAVLGEFRRTPVLVLTTDEGLVSSELGGIRWLFAFTDEDALSRFALARGSSQGQRWEYLRMRGARLLDVVVPQAGGPAGVALDSGSDHGFLFPPVPGVVPEAAALDLSTDSVPLATTPPPRTTPDRTGTTGMSREER